MIMINKLQITYDPYPYPIPLLSQCAAVKTNLGAISDPAHPPSLKYNKRVLDYEIKVELIIMSLSTKKYNIQCLLLTTPL